MATLYVAEYSTLASVPSSLTFGPQAGQAPQEPPKAEYVINITGSSTAGQLFGGYTAMIRVHTDAICSIAIGTAPTATTSTKRLAANQTEYFGVAPGQRIAVITNV
jgi:hypothetical protein